MIIFKDTVLQDWLMLSDEQDRNKNTELNRNAKQIGEFSPHFQLFLILPIMNTAPPVSST